MRMINLIILIWLMVQIDSEPIWIDMLLGIEALLYILKFVLGFVKGWIKTKRKQEIEYQQRSE